MLARVVRNVWTYIGAVFLMLISVTINFASDVQVSWQANKEADLAGYKIYYGTSSRNYSTHIDAGLNTSFVIRGLDDQIEYFFALTAYDTAGNESGYSSEISAILGDSSQPFLVSATFVSATEVMITFNEKIEKASAQDINNYQIDNGVRVTAAVLQADRRSVRLFTTEHASGLTYTLTVNNIRDIALPPNTIASGASISYTSGSSGQQQDTTPPTIVLANLISTTELRLYFSEPVAANSATDVSSYSIDNGIRILSSQMGEEANIVLLSTSEHASGTLYTIQVNNVTDESGNAIAANSSYSYSWQPGDVVGPMITLVTVPEVDQVEVMFNEPVEKQSAENTANYSVNGGIRIVAAQLDESRQIVKLNTSAHEPDHLYLLSVHDVRDVSVNKNKVAPNTSYAYVYEPVDRTGPTITKVDVVDQTHLKISFSEPVDRVSAEDVAHYRINNDVQVVKATLDPSARSVNLETTPHDAGKVYVLLVSEVKDASIVGNEIIPNSSYAYVYGSITASTGPTIVEVLALDATTLSVRFSKALDMATAQNAGNYNLNRGASVLSATLDNNGNGVMLKTSTLEPDKVYILTVNNVMDTEQNTILPNSSYSYIYEGEDTVGPVITLVKTVDRESIDILFNERLAQEEAENISNYEISGNITILGARLDGSRRVVHLQTTVHSPNKLYILRVNGLVDDSANRNEIAPNSSYSYLFESPDDLAPTIALVRLMDSRHLQVVFSESVDKESGTNKSNFSLNNDATIVAAEPGPADHIVNLTTSPLQAGKIYVLLVNGVKDLTGNTISANSAYTFAFGQASADAAPVVTSVEITGTNQLTVGFNTRVEKSAAENSANYRIQGGIAVQEARLDSSGRNVVLTTSEHEPGKLYVLTVSNIARFDNPAVTVNPGTPFFYIYENPVASGPAVEGLTMLGATLLEVRFTQSVERLSAENRHNYHANGGISILSVEIDETGRKVLLETSKHHPGVAYTLNISGVRGKDDVYAMSVVNATVAYTYLPNLQVNIDTDAEVSISFADVGREYYLDRNYVITQVPEDLLQARMIMTVNDDKANTDTRFMTIHLSQAAFVYIAYDSRAITVPNWLDARFTKTEMSLGVSDNAETLTLWQGYFPAGQVVLGGNNSAGARGAKSMYIVLILEPTFAQMPGGGQLEGSFGQGNLLPTTVELLPNYPNPFNPITKIRFDLPVDKQVKLEVFNILGRKVKTLYDAAAVAGQHTVIWDGTNDENTPVAAGIYIYRLQAWEVAERNGLQYRENYVTVTRKMTYLK